MTNLEFINKIINLLIDLKSYAQKKENILPFTATVHPQKYRNNISVNDRNNGEGCVIVYHFKTIVTNLDRNNYIVFRLNPKNIKIRFYDDKEIVIDISDINILNDETLFILTYGIDARELLKLSFTDEDKNYSISFLSQIKFMI